MNERKTIYLYVTTDLTYDQRMQRIASALAESGHKVTLIGHKKPTSKKLEFSTFRARRLKCIFNKGALFYAEFNTRIFWHVLFHRMNAVCAVDLDTLSGVTLAAKFKKLPVVFDAHEWFTQVPELIGRVRVQNLWKGIENRFLPLTAARYTVNKSLAEVFQEQHKLAFDVIRNVPQTVEQARIDKKKKIILYQGALNKGRGIEASILAMKQLDNYELWLAGEGDLSDALRRLAKDENVANRVNFLGFKTPAELKLITQQAYIGLNLLEGESKNYYYSLANKFFDYMQAGVPSINMNFPEYEVILTDHPCGLMIDRCDANHLLCAIRKITESEINYDLMANAGRLAAKQFNWEKEKEHLKKIWSRVLEV